MSCGDRGEEHTSPGSLIFLSDLFPDLLAELKADVESQPAVPSAMVTAFRTYMVDRRPGLLRDHVDKIGHWVLVSDTYFHVLCPPCSFADMLDAYEAERSRWERIEGLFIVRLGSEFEPGLGEFNLSTLTSLSSHSGRLTRDLIWRVGAVNTDNRASGFVHGMLVDTGSDEVVVTDYRHFLKVVWPRFPLAFTCETRASNALFPCISVISSPEVAVAGLPFVKVSRIVVPFDLRLSWNLFRSLLDPVGNPTFQNIPFEVLQFFDVVDPHDPAYQPLLQWLKQPFQVPDDVHAKRYLLSKGISLSESPFWPGFIGLSYLLQTDFSYSKVTGQFSISP